MRGGFRVVDVKGKVLHECGHLPLAKARLKLHGNAIEVRTSKGRVVLRKEPSSTSS